MARAGRRQGGGGGESVLALRASLLLRCVVDVAASAQGTTEPERVRDRVEEQGGIDARARWIAAAGPTLCRRRARSGVGRRHQRATAGRHQNSAPRPSVWTSPHTLRRNSSVPCLQRRFNKQRHTHTSKTREGDGRTHTLSALPFPPPSSSSRFPALSTTSWPRPRPPLRPRPRSARAWCSSPATRRRPRPSISCARRRR